MSKIVENFIGLQFLSIIGLVESGNLGVSDSFFIVFVLEYLIIEIDIEAAFTDIFTEFFFN